MGFTSSLSSPPTTTAGGNEKMKQLMPDIKIYGGSLENVQARTNKLDNGDKLSLGAEINILSLHGPCHTKGHISYYITGKEGDDPAVFIGDTLFIVGCGKIFEGTAKQMYQSLCTTFGCDEHYVVIYFNFALWH